MKRWIRRLLGKREYCSICYWEWSPMADDASRCYPCGHTGRVWMGKAFARYKERTESLRIRFAAVAAENARLRAENMRLGNILDQMGR